MRIIAIYYPVNNRVMKLKNKIFFSIYRKLYLLPHGYITLRKEKLAHKKKLYFKSSKKSIIFFTTHKCASKFFHKFFHELEKDTNYIKINFDEYALRYNIKNLDDLYYNYAQNKGFIYAPIRKMIKFKDMKNFKTVLALRDPRDTLISHYFSTVYSHDKNSINLLEERDYYKAMNIDEFVLDKADWLNNIMTEYMENLSNYYFINYEELIIKPHFILSGLLDYLSINIDEKKIIKFASDLIPNSNENKLKHKRSGKNNQFKTHLKDETIEILNEKFSKVIDYFKFNI